MYTQTADAGHSTGSDDHIRFGRTSEFARTLRRKLSAYRQSTGNDRFAGWSVWLKSGLATVIGTAGYCWLIGAGAATGTLPLIAATVLTGFCGFFLLVFLGHDAAHGSVSSRNWVNRALVFSVFALHGVSGRLWADRHITLHHAFPNVPGTGIDADSSDLVRLQPQRKPRRFQRFQPIYGPMLYVIGQWHLIWVEDFQDFHKARKQQTGYLAEWRLVLEFAATKLLHLTVFAGIPAILGGFTILQLLAGYLLATGTISFCFAALVIGTHVSDRAEFPETDESGRLPHDWATLQLVTSVDWGPTSRLFAELSGGANAHTAHHLFPTYAHRHASNLARLVIEAAQECGLNYRATSFAGMVTGHVRHLWKMSRPAVSQP